MCSFSSPACPTDVSPHLILSSPHDVHSILSHLAEVTRRNLHAAFTSHFLLFGRRASFISGNARRWEGEEEIETRSVVEVDYEYHFYITPTLFRSLSLSVSGYFSVHTLWEKTVRFRQITRSRILLLEENRTPRWISGSFQLSRERVRDIETISLEIFCQRIANVSLDNVSAGESRSERYPISGRSDVLYVRLNLGLISRTATIFELNLKLRFVN